MTSRLNGCPSRNYANFAIGELKLQFMYVRIVSLFLSQHKQIIDLLEEVSNNCFT